MDETPRLRQTSYGDWLALGRRWGVQAPTPEEALRTFAERCKLRAEIDARPDPSGDSEVPS